LFDGFRADCWFVFDAAEQRNPAMPADESRERDAGCQTLDPGAGSANSESSGQVDFAPGTALMRFCPRQQAGGAGFP